MRLSQTLMLSTAVASFLLAHQPASAQLSALGTCRRLLDTNPATPERSSETCFLRRPVRRQSERQHREL